ncbi:hypothetical protein VKR68_004414 [Escherichia coli]|nr:hypothetical protein [Escherichia coli]
MRLPVTRIWCHRWQPIEAANPTIGSTVQATISQAKPIQKHKFQWTTDCVGTVLE